MRNPGLLANERFNEKIAIQSFLSRIVRELKEAKERVQVVFTNAAKNLRLKNSPHIDFPSTQEKLTVTIEGMNVIEDGEYKEEDLKGFNLVQLKQIC